MGRKQSIEWHNEMNENFQLHFISPFVNWTFYLLPVASRSSLTFKARLLAQLLNDNYISLPFDVRRNQPREESHRETIFIEETPVDAASFHVSCCALVVALWKSRQVKRGEFFLFFFVGLSEQLFSSRNGRLSSRWHELSLMMQWAPKKRTATLLLLHTTQSDGCSVSWNSSTPQRASSVSPQHGWMNRKLWNFHRLQSPGTTMTKRLAAFLTPFRNQSQSRRNRIVIQSLTEKAHFPACLALSLVVELSASVCVPTFLCNWIPGDVRWGAKAMSKWEVPRPGECKRDFSDETAKCSFGWLKQQSSQPPGSEWGAGLSVGMRE